MSALNDFLEGIGLRSGDRTDDKPPQGPEDLDEDDGVENEDEIEEEEEEELEGKGVPDTGKYHRDIIAPSGFVERSRMAKVGKHWTQTLFIEGWPDEPQDGFLEEVLLGAPVQNDVSIHIEPYSPERAISELENALKKAEARLGQSQSMIASSSREKRFKETREVYNALTETDANLFDVGMYITIRHEDEDELSEAVDDIVRTLKTSPALTNPEIATHKQLDGVRSVSPILKDDLDYKTEMLGGAVGAMFPFSSTSLVHPEGVDFGVHSTNRSPVIVNRFSLDNGYNQLTIGKIGSGKSFSTSMNILRTYAARNDIIIFMLDPLGGFHNICDVLQGRTVTVGGRLGLNPMEIKSTPDEVVEQAPDLDPYAMKKNNLHDFFDMYFHTRGIELAESRGVLEQAIEATYAKKKIKRDISTHDRESPTIRELMVTLNEMMENPESFAETESPQEIDDIETHASRLYMGMQEFREGGQLQNLAGKSDLNLRGEDVVYFDLSQYEGSGNVGLMMHLLLSEVYERAKETDNKIMFAIDEAHYIMKDAKSLDFLEQVVRHSRHYDLSINFITQTIKEFFSHEKSATISEQCSIRLFHRIEQGLTEDIINQLDLTQSEAQFIRNAQPGDPEVGYSEALIGVGQRGYMPIQVIASRLEEEVITSDSDEIREALGGGARTEDRQLPGDESGDDETVSKAVSELEDTLQDQSGTL